MSRILAWVVLCFLTGCVGMPTHENKAELSGPVAMPPIAGDDFAIGAWPAEDWWTMFGDPQLNALICQGLEHSPTLKQAIAQVEEAMQLAKIARSTLFPELDANAQTNWQYLARSGLFRSFAPTFPPVINQIDVGLNFSYEIDFWGKNRKKYQAALGDAKAQEAELAQTTLILTTAIAATYFDAQGIALKIEILQETLQTRELFLEYISDRKEAGIDNELARLNAEQQVFEIEKTIADLEKQLAVAGHLVQVLIGQGPYSAESFETMAITFASPFPLPASLETDLLARRPDLMAQIWRVEAAAKLVGAARTEFYPNVDLSALFGFESLQFNNLLTAPNKSLSLLPAFHLPIFTGGRLKANLKAKFAAFDEAVYSYNDMVLTAAKEVADQMSTLKAIDERLQLQEEKLSSIEQSYALTERRFIHGIDNYPTVLTVNEEVLSEKFTTIDLSVDRLLAAVNLIKALGGGYETERKEP